MEIDEVKKDILVSLDIMSDQVGKIITEHHWRELQNIIVALRDIWNISDEEYIKLLTEKYYAKNNN